MKLAVTDQADLQFYIMYFTEQNINVLYAYYPGVNSIFTIHTRVIFGREIMCHFIHALYLIKGQTFKSRLHLPGFMEPKQCQNTWCCVILFYV